MLVNITNYENKTRNVQYQISMMGLCVVSIYLTNTTAYWEVYNVVTLHQMRRLINTRRRDWIPLYNVYSSNLFRQKQHSGDLQQKSTPCTGD